MSVTTPAARRARIAHIALLFGACTLPLVAGAGRTLAQSVDYGDLEQLFGEPVTTSATGKPQRASQVPGNMEIITADDIRRSGASNLPDVLRLVPGVDVRRYGLAAAEVSIRGYDRPSNPRLLVLLNGQQVYFDDYGRTQWDAIPVELEEIRQIEVIKGPNSALYGFNAASGVINIITWDPSRDRTNVLVARGGTQNYRGLTAIGTVPLGDSGGVRLSAGGFKAREFASYRIDPMTLALKEAPERGAISADGRFRVTPGVEAALSGSMVNLRTFEPVGNPLYAGSYYRTASIRAAVTAETRIGQIGLSAYTNQLTYTNRVDLRNDVTVAQANYLVKLGASHTVRLGLEYRDNSEFQVPDGSRIGYKVFAESAMWNWEITPRLALTNAVRLDHLALEFSGPLIRQEIGRSASAFNNRRFTDVSFNSGLTWRATDDDVFRLTLARGLQAPSLASLGIQFEFPTGPATPPIALIGQPNLSPSAVSHAELGYDREVRSLASTIRTAVFAQRTDDVLTDPSSFIPVLTQQGVVFTSANAGHSSSIGSEIGIRGKANGFRWNASYAYISISDHISGAGRQTWLDFQHGTPTHVVLLGGGYSWGRVEADIQGRWQSRFRDYVANGSTFSFEPIDVPNYVQLNARVGYKLTEGLTVALTANQFNVSRLMQTSGAPVERQILVSGTARF